jgi:hypothetical protein
MASTIDADSSVSPPFINIPFLAPTPVPTITAVLRGQEEVQKTRLHC